MALTKTHTWFLTIALFSFLCFFSVLVAISLSHRPLATLSAWVPPFSVQIEFTKETWL